MLKTIVKSLCILILFSCNNSKNENSELKEQTQSVIVPKLNLLKANKLSKLPFFCINNEYPNKLNQTLGGSEDLKSPKTLHPAFYGCFDWHSSVHGHWSLIRLLKQFPNLENSDKIKEKLLISMSKNNILKEIEYFKGRHNKSYERTYGWAWLLKLAEEIHTWDTDYARPLEDNLQPLTVVIVEKYKEFLPKLNYPIRIGDHANTAFGLSFAWDYAMTTKDENLKKIIEERARYFYLGDENCPMNWEPGGFDFLSPCLEEAALMKRVLTINEFKKWIDNFLPQLKDKYFKLETGIVSDRSDGKLVHLDGLNFSRAWDLNKIAEGLPEFYHLKGIANTHINYSLPSVAGDNYEGGHWLGTFAIYALNSVSND
jgi:hypothetical protein